MIAVLGLGAVALPALSLELGLPGDESSRWRPPQRRAYDLLSEGFGPGFNGQLTVVADTSESEDTRATTDLVAKTVRGVDGVASVGEPVLSRTKDTAVLTAVPRTAPNSGETKDLVHAIRGSVSGAEAGTGAAVLVTGTMIACSPGSSGCTVRPSRRWAPVWPSPSPSTPSWADGDRTRGPGAARPPGPVAASYPDRVLPNIDIEGEARSRRVPASATGPDAAERRLPVGGG
ncbi:putative membrane protein YdfJ [Streptomyces afghaniensis 772] [Streptomyces afghaniensis]